MKEESSDCYQDITNALLRLIAIAITALLRLRLISIVIKALLRLITIAIKVLLRLYGYCHQGSIKTLLRLR